jgi:hypothetical protein
MSQDERSEGEGGVDAHIQRLVAGGYDDRIAVIDRVTDFIEGRDTDDPDAMADGDAEDLIRALPTKVGTAIARQLAVQAGWPEVTDCDRLDAAFAKLEANGIVARQNFTCCQNCGFAEIGAEVADVQDAGTDVRGVTFFHQQDADRAVDGGSIYLSYGATHDDGANSDGSDSVEIAREIVAVLNAHGLKPNWDGTTAQRIEVPLNWRRRFPVSDAPASEPVKPARDLWSLFGFGRSKG